MECALQVMGYVACYETTRNLTCQKAVLNFVKAVMNGHAWSTGGTSTNEHWGAAMRMGDGLMMACHMLSIANASIESVYVPET